MNTFGLGIDIGHGCCTLRLRTPEADLQLRTHWLVDGLTELALAVEALLAGRPSVSVRWVMEMAGGHFIDIVADPQGQVHLAVTALEHGLGASTADEIWSPVRGQMVVRRTVPLSEFIRQYLSAMRVVRITRVDGADLADFGVSSQEVEPLRRRLRVCEVGPGAAHPGQRGPSDSPRTPAVAARGSMRHGRALCPMCPMYPNLRERWSRAGPCGCSAALGWRRTAGCTSCSQR